MAALTRVASTFPGWPAAAVTLVERKVADGAVRVYADAPGTVPELLARSVAECPDLLAVAEVGGRTLSYEQLWEKAGRLAAGLQQRFDVEPGDRVALLHANGVDFVVSLLAVLRAGAVGVPLNTKYTEVELAPLVTDCGARLLLGDAEWSTKAKRACAGLRTVVVTGAGVATGKGRDAAYAGGFDDPDPRPENTALLVYTSGTTGRSKGAVLTHLNVVQAALTYARCLDLGPDERTPVAVPLFHVTGLIGQLLPVLAGGGSATILRRFDAGLLASLLAEEPFTFFHAAPSVYLLTLAAMGARRAAALRLALCGGGAISPASVSHVLEFAPGVDFRTVYGLTETSSPATLMPARQFTGHPRSSGVAVPVNDVRVDAPTGEPGEVLVRGATIASGYHESPQVTAQVFDRGWLRTGDVGTLDELGFLTIVDRLKDMINRGGEKVSSLELEQVLHEHPAVAECAVVAGSHSVYGEVPRAFVVIRPGAETSPEELCAFAATRLAKFKVPEEIRFVDSLPRNPSGKVLKRRLRKDLL